MARILKTADDIETVRETEMLRDGDPSVTYDIRHLTTGKHREVVNANTVKVPNPRTHQRDDVTNWEAVSDDLLDYVITGWSGVIAFDKPAECKRDLKLLLDGPIKTAILEKAGMNQIAAAPERRAESFRPAEDVR